MQVQAQVQAPLQVAVLLQPLALADVLAREREQVPALEMTAALLRRAPACLVRRLLEAQRPSGDQMPRRHLDQRPRNRT